MRTPSMYSSAYGRIAEYHPALRKQLHVGLRGFVLVHCGVHRRGDDFRRFARKPCGGQHIVGYALRKLGNDVRGSGRDDEHVRFFCERNVLHVVLFALVESPPHHLAVGESLEGQRRDELFGVRRHDDVHFRAEFFEPRHNLAAFVSGNAAAYAEYNALSVKHQSRTIFVLPS